MSDLMELFEMSVKLREIHQTMKRLRGPEFAQDVKELEPLICDIAALTGDDFFAAATKLAKNAENMTQTALILAVAVEVKLRTLSEKISEQHS